MNRAEPLALNDPSLLKKRGGSLRDVSHLVAFGLKSATPSFFAAAISA